MAEGKEKLLHAGVQEGKRAGTDPAVCSDGRDRPEILLTGEARATKQRGLNRARSWDQEKRTRLTIQ